eukprot:scaffold15702_cov66-Phaeocystis_antarctica.AAC.15
MHQAAPPGTPAASLAGLPASWRRRSPGPAPHAPPPTPYDVQRSAPHAHARHPTEPAARDGRLARRAARARREAGGGAAAGEGQVMNRPWSRVAIGDAWPVAARARGLAGQWVRLCPASSLASSRARAGGSGACARIFQRS